MGGRIAALIPARVRRLLSPPRDDRGWVPAGSTGEGLKLHVGCGMVKLDGWVNIDSNPACSPDCVMDLRELGEHFQPGSISEILSVHSVNYLRLWEAQDFFASCFRMLRPGGELTIETPMFDKIAREFVSRRHDRDGEIECVRAMFAFGLDDMAVRRGYEPYRFSWTESLIKAELGAAGFSRVKIADPLTHGRMKWRDSRIVATKA